MERTPPDFEGAFAEAQRHHRAGRLTEAEALCRQVLAAAPRHAGSLHLLGLVACACGHPDDGIALIRHALALAPDSPKGHNGLGVALHEAGDRDGAISHYRRALELAPDYPEAMSNLGAALQERGDFDAAIHRLQAAIALGPDSAEAHTNLATTLLAAGDLAAGWPEYEWRWGTPTMTTQRRAFTQPQWRGEMAAGRTLLIHAEQGLGDTIQFCRYAPLAAARGLRVTLEVQPPLLRLLGCLPGIQRVIGRGDPLPEFDLHCPLLSLPLAFATRQATIPAQPSYLVADRALAASWATRLAGANPKIGLAWAGNPRLHSAALAAIDRRRSIPPERLAPLVELPGLDFFSLQNGGAAAPAGFPLTDFMADMTDFADTAALVANLDLVISVDTAIAHLAAALGKPVWLLNRFDSCWRWLRHRQDSPWYPTLRLFNQPKPGDWAAVIEQVRDELARHLTI